LKLSILPSRFIGVFICILLVVHGLAPTLRADSPPQTAVLTNPADGAAGVVVTTFQWTSVPSAQAYYLYVGTTPGANDVVNTGEIQATSYTVTSLPYGQTLYATMLTKIAGIWWRIPSTFTTAPQVAALTSVGNGTVNVPVSGTLQWSSAPNAQAYRLTLGSTAGAADVLDTGSIAGTSYAVSGLPFGQLLYATVYTEIGGIW
jgi:hypothetical protein